MTGNDTAAPAEEAVDAGRHPDDAEGRRSESAELAALRTRAAELEDRWRRALADLDNLRKRTARDAQRQIDDERDRITAQWLPVVDSLERALEHARADPAEIVPGVKAVHSLAVELLARLGYPRREDVGAKFDPAHHDAVSTSSTAEVPEGTVVQVLRPGYGSDERQLRPASVVVASRPD
ncbi:MAG TPA: nucleotide exchange factor GrpE [Mycobacteriales bacterium]|nr:nucleotide exchange factor GrpE [Mycobacteriales bacterium]